MLIKKIGKFIIYILCGMLLFAGIIAGAVFLLRDKIVQLFVNEANKSINAQIFVEKIDLDFWQTFPRFSIEFKNVKIMEAVKGSKKHFAVADKVFFSFSLKDLLQEKYTIKNLYIKNADVCLHVFKDEGNNFSIFKKSETDSKTAIVFDLADARLENVNVEYKNDFTENVYSGYFKEAKAGFKLKGDDWQINVKGDIQTHTIKIRQWEFLKEKPIFIESKIIYSQSKKIYTITPSKVKILNAYFNVEGTYHASKNPFIDFKFSEDNSDFQTIISFLPQKISNPLKAYKSEGEVYFKGFIKGLTKRGNKLDIKVNFGCKDASFYNPEIKEGLEHATFTGKFDNGGQVGVPSALILENIQAQMKGRPISGNFSLTDFNDPYIELNAKSSIDAGYFFKVFPSEHIENAKGEFDFDIVFKGKTHDIKHKNFKSLYSSGEIRFTNFNLKLKNYINEFSGCNGTFIFNKNDLSANRFTGTIGHSDFYFNGILSNIIPYVLYPNESLLVDADLKCKQVDLDDLLKSTSSAKSEPYKLAFSSALSLNLNCKIDRLNFQKFKSENIEGIVNLSGQRLTCKDIKMNVAKGKLMLDGSLLQRKDTTFDSDVKFRLEKMEIDSIYFMTANFGQEFLTYKNLKGQITADVKTSFILDKYLHIITKTLFTDVTTIIKNGQLINFKPMKNLARFVNEEALENIKFSELKNTIQISNSVVFIPEMEIKSNITNMSVMGSHSFDNYFDYRLKIPLRNYKKKGNLEEELAIEGDASGGFYLYITIKGTPDNFKVAYDKSAVKEKIKERWKEEKKEFKEIFQKDYQKKKIEKEKAKEANQDDYFDFN